MPAIYRPIIKVLSKLSDPNLLTNQSNAPQSAVIGASTGIPLRNGVRSADSVEQAINHYIAAQTQINLLRFPWDRPKYYFQMVFSDYRRIDALSVDATLSSGTIVQLPIPLGIVDTHDVTWGPEALGNVFGPGFSPAMQGVKNIRASTNPISAVSAFTGAATKAAIDIGASSVFSGLPDGAENAVRAATGLSPNEFLTILLQGPTYKTFTMSWSLVPKNFQEAKMIRDMIAFLNNAMSPGLALGDTIWSFPQVVRCAFQPNYKYLFRFKPAVITGLQADYAPSGGLPTFYHDTDGQTADGVGASNPPEAIRLTLSFLEMEYWLKNDFKGPVGLADDTTATPAQRQQDAIIDVQGIADSVTSIGSAIGAAAGPALAAQQIIRSGQ